MAHCKSNQIKSNHTRPNQLLSQKSKRSRRARSAILDNRNTSPPLCKKYYNPHKRKDNKNQSKTAVATAKRTLYGRLVRASLVAGGVPIPSVALGTPRALGARTAVPAVKGVAQAFDQHNPTMIYYRCLSKPARGQNSPCSTDYSQSQPDKPKDIQGLFS